MKVKVCGMKEPDNIKEILTISPDYIGFIFYEKSKRFVNEKTLSFIKKTKIDCKKVGVFVNEKMDVLKSIVEKYSLDFVQLHGTESPQYVSEINQSDISVIKAFNIDELFQWDSLYAYANDTKYFLFDTASSTHGGSGKKFDWSLLKNYNYKKPYILSGGISIDDTEKLKAINSHYLHAVDINSRFEENPGLKNTELVSKFLKELRDEKLPS